MNLYIIREVLYDYSGGMVAIKARDIEQAAEFFKEWIHSGYPGLSDWEDYVVEFNTSVRAGYYHELVLSTKDTHKPGVVTQVWGGG